MKYGSILIALVFLSACKENCKNVLPPPSYFEINVSDGSGNDLIGTTYPQDSFKLYNDNSALYVKPVPYSDSSTLQVFYSKLTTGTTYFLELNSTDTDTLYIAFTTTEEKCYTDYSLTELVYNGSNLATGAGMYTVIK